MNECVMPDCKTNLTLTFWIIREQIKLVTLFDSPVTELCRAGPHMIAIIFMLGTIYACNDSYYEDQI